MQVLALVNSMSAGLEKHGLGNLMSPPVDPTTGLPVDPMPAELRQLKADLEKDALNVTLTVVAQKPDSRYIELFQRLSSNQMELLRHCGKYADFKRWLKDSKYLDEEEGLTLPTPVDEKKDSAGSAPSFPTPVGGETKVAEEKQGTIRFNKMINHVTQLLQGESYDEEVLSSLMQARPVMALFRAPPTLTDLVAAVGKLTLPSLQPLDVVEKNLTQIQEWLEDSGSHTFGKIMGQLTSIMAHGKAYVTVASKTAPSFSPVALDIRFPVGKLDPGMTPEQLAAVVYNSMTEDQLADFAQAVIFNSNDREQAPAAAVAGEGKEEEAAAAATAAAPARQYVDVGQFLEAIDVLRQLRAVAEQLFTEVHVTAMGADQFLVVQDVAGNKAKLAEFEETLSLRRQQLKSLRKLHPHLTFLLLPQMLRFMERVQWCQTFFAGVDEEDDATQLPANLREEVLM